MDVFTVLVVGNPKGSIGRSSMIYMMVKKIKKMLLQYKITLLLALYLFLFVFQTHTFRRLMLLLQIKQLGWKNNSSIELIPTQ